MLWEMPLGLFFHLNFGLPLFTFCNAAEGKLDIWIDGMVPASVDRYGACFNPTPAFSPFSSGWQSSWLVLEDGIESNPYLLKASIRVCVRSNSTLLACPFSDISVVNSVQTLQVVQSPDNRIPLVALGSRNCP
jgi:hypothetical protein